MFIPQNISGGVWNSILSQCDTEITFFSRIYLCSAATTQKGKLKFHGFLTSAILVQVEQSMEEIKCLEGTESQSAILKL